MPFTDKPAAAALLGTEPNPFSNSTVIRYRLAEAAHVLLVVHDMQGRVVATLVNEEQGVGEHQARFDASALPTGIYGYTLTTDDGEAFSGVMNVVK